MSRLTLKDFTKLGHSYKYEHLDCLSAGRMRAYCERLRGMYRRVATAWDCEQNSEWLTRHYLALKMIAGASVLYGGVAHALATNLRIAVPYLAYYAALSCARAVLFTLPQRAWQCGGLIEASHGKISAAVVEQVALLDDALAAEINRGMTRLRTTRELFSYRFPADGPKHIGSEGRLIEWLQVMAELAQLNSECLQAVLEEQPRCHEWSIGILAAGFVHEVNGQAILDDEDHLRVEQYVRRNGGAVCNLQGGCSEGLVDDFFGAWTVEEGDPHGLEIAFDPDANCRSIFSFR